jgi:uncharacterized protein (DUF1684 family)
LAAQIEVQSEDLALDHARHQAWAKRQNRELKARLAEVTSRIGTRWQAYQDRRVRLAQLAHGAISDHEYIEAMFSLYTQGRYRLV